MKKIKIIKKIGVWMDHSNAQLLEYGKSADDLQIISSGYISHPRIKGMGSDSTMFSSASGKGFHISNNEYKKNNIEQNKINKFYKVLEKELAGFDDILLSGATHAKDEFFNHIKAKKEFKNKAIQILTKDHLTTNQFVALVNKELGG